MTTQRLFVPVCTCSLNSELPQAIPTASSTYVHCTPQTAFFYRSALLYGTHSCTTYNHSRKVNHFAKLSRVTTNHVNLPQQKTFTHHSLLSFLSLRRSTIGSLPTQFDVFYLDLQIFSLGRESSNLSTETPSIRVLPKATLGQDPLDLSFWSLFYFFTMV